MFEQCLTNVSVHCTRIPAHFCTMKAKCGDLEVKQQSSLLLLSFPPFHPSKHYKFISKISISKNKQTEAKWRKKSTLERKRGSRREKKNGCTVKIANESNETTTLHIRHPHIAQFKRKILRILRQISD